MRRHSTVGDNKRTLWFILNPSTYAHKFGQTTTTRNPTSSSIHDLTRVGESWSHFSRKLHVESSFRTHCWLWLYLLQLQTSTSNLELLSTNLTLHAVVFLLMFFSWPGGTRGRWYGVVFSSLGDRWEQTSFEDVPWKKKPWAAYVESRIRIRKWTSVWTFGFKSSKLLCIFRYIMMFPLNLQKAHVYFWDFPDFEHISPRCSDP